MSDGLLLRGRLLRLVAPEAYTRRDGSAGASYPAAVFLVGSETVKVEYRDLASRDAALRDYKIGEVLPDGMVPGMPLVEVPVNPSAFCRDHERAARIDVRFGGA